MNRKQRYLSVSLSILLVGAGLLLLLGLNGCSALASQDATPVGTVEAASEKTAVTTTQVVNTVTPSTEVGEYIRLLDAAGCDFAGLTVHTNYARKESTAIEIGCIFQIPQ